MGHELGHWVMHAGRGDSRHIGVVHCREREVREAVVAGPAVDLSASYLGYPPEELDANQFAAALLVPARLALDSDEFAPEVLSRRFDVSLEAVTRRLWFLEAVRGSEGAGPFSSD